MKYSALIGHPVDHSVSPALFSLLARQIGLDYCHMKIDVTKESELPQFLDAFKTLSFCGLNVTIPYKLKIMSYLDEIDISAKKVGAVNSIIFKNGKMIGYNTDGTGAIMAIKDQLRPVKEKDRVLVIGAGGAARAIIFELYKQTKNIKIINRYTKEAQLVAKDLGNKAGPIKTHKLNDANLRNLIQKTDLVVNATPVGMHPDGNQEIVKDEIFEKIKDIDRKLFFDAIFNPFYTKFLESAQKRNAKVCSGMYMMIYQAVAALKLWTGKEIGKIDSDKIAKLMQKELHQNLEL